MSSFHIPSVYIYSKSIIIIIIKTTYMGIYLSIYGNAAVAVTTFNGAATASTGNAATSLVVNVNGAAATGTGADTISGKFKSTKLPFFTLRNVPHPTRFPVEDVTVIYFGIYNDNS